MECLAIGSACFVPDCVRKAAEEEKLGPLDGKDGPHTLTFFAIILTIEIPVVVEIIDYYSVSITYSAEQVAEELDLHVTNLINCIKTGGGDVIQFEDGILQSMWTVEPDNAANIAKRVLNVALFIQKNYDDTKTKFGRNLTNLIGISIGDVNMFFVGAERIRYVLVGDVVQESLHASTICIQRAVVVSPKFWEKLASSDSYKFQTLQDEYVKVYSGKVVQSLTSLSGMFGDLKQRDSIPSDSELATYLWKYLPTPHDQARTYGQVQVMSSVSQIISVAIHFHNLNISNPDSLQNVILVIEDIIQKSGGILRNVLFFDLNFTVSICFGYPGAKHNDDAVRSILCSQDIVKVLRKQNVRVTIGIFSGIAFCGVLGPPIRKICVVLGLPINNSYLGIRYYSEFEIICGINIFFVTRRTLGKIFEAVKENTRRIKNQTIFKVQVEPDEFKPDAICSGRKEDKKNFKEAMLKLKTDIIHLKDTLPLIIITGKLGSGKTIFFNWAMEQSRKLGFKLTVNIKNTVFEEPFDNSWTIVKTVLRDCNIDSDQKVLDLFGDPNVEEIPLYLLNRMINTSFPVPSKTFSDSDLRALMVSIVKKCVKNQPLIIGIDNAEHTGTESWLFLQDLLMDHIAIVIATFTTEFHSGTPFIKNILEHKFTEVNLLPLSLEEIGILACHILNVQAINKELVKLLEEHSKGNSLLLREILMINPMKKHLHILPRNEIPDQVFESSFLPAEETDDCSKENEVCDIKNQNELRSLKIPSNLIEIFRDHTVGLGAEEQMLLRKCVLLGESFGLYVLAAVCPEYPADELLFKAQNLMKKHILMFGCDHLGITDDRDRPSIYIHYISLEFCSHPLKFSSEYMRRCVINAMAERQRERLNLYLADLLKISSRVCDACKRESVIHPSIIRNYRLPHIDMRLCHCLSLRTHVLLQIEYQLQKGIAPVEERTATLLSAAEEGLKTKNYDLVENIINKAKRLVSVAESAEEADAVQVSSDKVTISRLRAQLKMKLGKNTEALRYLKQAMLLMGITFPADIKQNIYKKKKFDGTLGREEVKCLGVGSFITMALGDYDFAYDLAKLQLKFLLKEGYTFDEIILTKTGALNAVAKSKPGKSRESATKKYSSEIEQQCFRRLIDYPVLDITEINVVAKAFITIIRLSLEKAELEVAEELGRKAYELMKIVKNQKALSRILGLMALIYDYLQNFDKCVEIVNQLQDAVLQSDDVIAQIYYYIALVKTLNEEKSFPEMQSKEQIHWY
nr:adenylate cyclase type 10 [Parasteatoda tepidariorum]